MKLKDLKPVLYSHGMGCILWTILWDTETCKDIANGCSVEWAIANYGDSEVKRISAYESNIVIEL